MKGSTDSLSAGSVNLLKGNRILDFYNGIYCENVSKNFNAAKSKYLICLH